MEIVGKEVRSKNTGAKGVITKIDSNFVYVNFEASGSISIPIKRVAVLLQMDEETLGAVESISKIVQSQSATTHVKRNSEQRKDIVHSKIDVLDADEKVCFYKVADVLNACFGTDYLAWMKATWKLNSEYRCWFPKLVKTLKDEPAAYGCVNVISEDWNTLVFDDRKTDAEDYRDVHREYRIIFAREPDNGPILFRGIYIPDEKESTYKHYVFNRIATKIRIVGDPAYDIEILNYINQ